VIKCPFCATEFRLFMETWNIHAHVLHCQKVYLDDQIANMKKELLAVIEKNNAPDQHIHNA